MSRNTSLILFLVAVAVCAVGQVALLRDVVTGKAPAAVRTKTARWSEITWAVLPALVLLVILTLTWRMRGRIHP